ncbi:MAG: hypothetical protein NT178_06660, partial [Proteobacteria bacterium]|nr:hypothetical protein [Pseudomonadota bacterium]
MSLCQHCSKDTEDPKTTTCFNSYVDFEDSCSLPREPYAEDETERCSVCHVVPGAYHHKDCYMERCPRCGKRLISCGCLAKR